MTAPDISDSALELLERRIADRVTEQARTRVFAYYAIVGTTIAAVLGIVGWNAIAWVEREASREIGAQIAQRTKQVDEASLRLAGLQTSMATQLDVLDALAKRAGRVVDDVDDKVRGFAPKADKLEQAVSDIDGLEVRVRSVREAIDLSDLNRTNIDRISAELAALAQQVHALAEAGRTSPASPSSTGTYGAIAGAIEKVAAGTASIRSEIAASRARATVYLQFAGITRDAADGLRSALFSDAYQFPPAERTTSATRLFEVRYFYAADREPAEKLAAAATVAIKSAVPNEYRTARVTDLTGFRGTKPREGTLELWYGPQQ